MGFNEALIMQKKYPFIVIFSLTALLFQGEVKAMFKMCLFSEVNGVVLDGGKPVVNAVVKRTYNWGIAERSDTTDEQTTDENGRFSFPSAHTRSFWYIVPHNPRIRQKIIISANGTEYQAWSYSKGNYDVNGELLGKPMKLLCEVTAPEEVKEANRINNFHGLCEIVDSLEGE
jgi:hypothetical protein